MPDAPAYYRWNPASERYIAPSGRYVSRAAVRASLDSVLDMQMERVRTLSQDLVAGNLSLSGWRAEMVTSIKVAQLEGASVARGGWLQLTTSDYTWVTQRIRDQLGYLQRFHDDLAYGRVPMDGTIASRAAMYVEAGRGTQREMERRMAGARGEELEKNIGGDSASSCGECSDCGQAGWVPLGTLPAVGSRTCLSRCRCYLRFKMGIIG